MCASPRHDKSPNDNVDDEIEEGLEAFPVSVGAESENNNFLTSSRAPRVVRIFGNGPNSD